ncbi:MAG: T9SS type A sorting domain-containing protein [Candidatus Eisenbacteria bacterium]
MRRTSLARLTLATFALLLLPALASADWPRDLGTGGLPVCSANYAQTSVQVVPDGSGGTIMVWADNRTLTNDIYAQRVSAAGVPLWTANGLAVCSFTGNQSQPKVVSDGAGGAIICWSDNRNATTDIYAQRINGNGLSLWTSQGISVCNATGVQDQYAITTDAAGGALLAWRDARGGTGDIYVQRLSSGGTALWGANGLVICAAPDMQQLPAICEDGAGGCYVSWTDSRSLASNATDIYLQHLNSAGTSLYTANGWDITNRALDQFGSAVCHDGVGGVLVAWSENSGGSNYDIFAQHVLANSGSLAFPSDVPVCTAAGSETFPTIVPDGSGGAFLTWSDYRSEAFFTDAYVARMTANGILPWTANGVGISTTTFSQALTSLVADGAGGVVVTWCDQHNTGGVDYDVYVQRLNSAGTSVWTTGGVPVITAVSDQVPYQIVANPDDSYTLAWVDSRNATGTDIYAQRIDRYGKLGDASPAITKVKDVPNDQGGLVKVSWNASYLDADPTYGIFEYRVFRSVPGSIAGLAAKRTTTTDSDIAATTGALLLTPNNATATAWEYLGTQPAEALDSYSRVCATTSDSLGGSNPRTYFMVEARAGTAASSQRWSSAPDSGYSVDNLGPAAPAPLTGQYFAGTTRLHWNPNTEADLEGYRVYRGNSVSFVPSPANLVSAQPDTGAVDAAGSAYVYKVTAVDVHRNESPAATILPSGTLGVSDAPAALDFAVPQPNPARGATTLRWTLPQAAHVTLALYDAAGRRVASVANGVMEAGAHSATLRLEDAQGRALPNGLYLARFEAMGRTITRRIAAIR